MLSAAQTVNQASTHCILLPRVNVWPPGHRTLWVFQRTDMKMWEGRALLDKQNFSLSLLDRAAFYCSVARRRAP
jgi:hypothetical protein